jgi:LPS sulfotransferase NodH
MIRFLILALPRTGSSTLQHVFSGLRGVPFIREPFNRNEWPGAHPPSIRGVADLAERLRILAAPGPVHAVKHVHDPLHWELGTPGGWELLEKLCRLPDCRIVFLYRQNILRQFLSTEIAHQTKNWGNTSEAAVPPRAGPVRQGEGEPWSEAQIERALELLQRTNERILSELTNSGASFLPFSYETLYEPAAPAIPEFNRIAVHFGVAPFEPRDEPALEAALVQGDRQATLSSLSRSSGDLRKLDAQFGGRFGRGWG